MEPKPRVPKRHAVGVGVLKNRKAKITVETHRVVLVVDPAAIQTAWCGLCASMTKWVTPDCAAAMIGVSSRTIYRWVESQRLHFIETPAGLLLICLDSLPEPGPGAGLTPEIFNGT